MLGEVYTLKTKFTQIQGGAWRDHRDVLQPHSEIFFSKKKRSDLPAYVITAQENVRRKPGRTAVSMLPFDKKLSGSIKGKLRQEADRWWPIPWDRHGTKVQTAKGSFLNGWNI